ncbi:hypothetical protein ACJX0J_036826, partial [Zea mays]
EDANKFYVQTSHLKQYSIGSLSTMDICLIRQIKKGVVFLNDFKWVGQKLTQIHFLTWFWTFGWLRHHYYIIRTTISRHLAIDYPFMIHMST